MVDVIIDIAMSTEKNTSNAITNFVCLMLVEFFLMECLWAKQEGTTKPKLVTGLSWLLPEIIAAPAEGN